jgi:hypothetical protein
MAKQSQQTPSKPPADPVADAEAVLASLERDRAVLIEAVKQDDAERSKVAFRAHALHELEATRVLTEITGRAIERGAQLRSLDLAIDEAAARVKTAQAAEVAAVNWQRAAELGKHVDDLAEVLPYIDKHLAAALRGLIALDRGVVELHQKGIGFPSDIQLRLGIVAVLGTWLQQLPKMWFNEISGGVPFRAPAQRKSAISYWTQIEPSLRNAIRQVTGEAERTNTEAA